MVRRLKQRFLHWLRQLLTSTNGPKNRSQTLKSSPQLSPTVQPQTIRSTQPTSSHGLHPSTEFSNHNQSEYQPPQAPLNPASPRAANPSRFKVLISDYDYSPNQAVQDLSHQLSHPQASTDRSQKQSQDTPKQQTVLPKAIQDLGRPTAGDSSVDDHEQLHTSVLLTSQQERRFSPIASHILQPHPFPTQQSEASNIEEIPQSHVSAKPLNLPTTRPNQQSLITKQGVVKLLFKLKKNNHHGYIAPEDGSKDIIFHKKFIGDDVFSQLERGMKVEVTAHITAGKAYADHIRIL